MRLVLKKLVTSIVQGIYKEAHIEVADFSFKEMDGNGSRVHGVSRYHGGF